MLQEGYPDIVRIFQLIRYEGQSWAAHLSGKLRPRQYAAIARLRGQSGLKLNVASGGTAIPGWVNIDVSSAADIRMDLRKPLPLREGSASLLFCEHFCDHLNYPFAIGRFLQQCHRVLEPGGRARFVLHDAEDLMRACVERDARYFELSGERHPTMMTTVNHLFRFNGLHQFLYDRETFEMLLRAAGFTQVIRCRFRQSDVPGLVLDVDHPSREVMSMYIEAVK